MGELSDLIEILEASTKNSEGKKYIFPRNVSKEYNILPGITAKVVVKNFIPSSIGMIIILAMPSYTMTAWIVKGIIDCAILLFVIIFALGKPISARKNVTMKQFLIYRIGYARRQKRCFIEGRKNRNDFK